MISLLMDFKAIIQICYKVASGKRLVALQRIWTGNHLLGKYMLLGGYHLCWNN